MYAAKTLHFFTHYWTGPPIFLFAGGTIEIYNLEGELNRGKGKKIEGKMPKPYVPKNCTYIHWILCHGKFGHKYSIYDMSWHEVGLLIPWAHFLHSFTYFPWLNNTTSRQILDFYGWHTAARTTHVGPKGNPCSRCYYSKKGWKWKLLLFLFLRRGRTVFDQDWLGCQIFLGTKYQNGEKYTKLPRTIPNVHKI
jgi:hypothetical protein